MSAEYTDTEAFALAPAAAYVGRAWTAGYAYDAAAAWLPEVPADTRWSHFRIACGYFCPSERYIRAIWEDVAQRQPSLLDA